MPSPYNPEMGSGMCQVLVDWYEKHRQKGIKPRQRALEQAYLELGARFGTPQAIFWPLSDRNLCNRFSKVCA